MGRKWTLGQNLILVENWPVSFRDCFARYRFAQRFPRSHPGRRL